MTRQMQGSTPAAVRAQLGRFGFSGQKATTEVKKLSGGERARLALALITREAPHMLILDEPTNHLDVDAREALVQALNGYSGAVVLVSHDRHMLELTADRLVLVDSGTAKEFSGSIEDYTDFILGKNQPKADGGTKGGKKGDRASQAQDRQKAQQLRKDVTAAEAELERLTKERNAIDEAMFAPDKATPKYAQMTMGDLSRLRGEVNTQVDAAEQRWLALSEQLEMAA